MTRLTLSSSEQRELDAKNLGRLKSVLPPLGPLARRICECGEERGSFPHQHVFFCNQPPCPRCRRRYRNKQAQSLASRFEAEVPDDMALFTVVLTPTTDAGEIPSIFTSARQALRNLMNTRRQKWPEIEMVGWLETDALADDDMPLLGSHRSAMLLALNAHPPLGGAPLWLPTIHGIVALRGLAHQEFRMALEGRWGAPRQVDVQPFFTDRPVRESVENIVRYSLKHWCIKSLRGVYDPWPSSWLGAYYSSLHNHAGGFRGISFTYGIRRRVRQIISSQSSAVLERVIEPMPIVL